MACVRFIMASMPVVLPEFLRRVLFPPAGGSPLDPAVIAASGVVAASWPPSSALVIPEVTYTCLVRLHIVRLLNDSTSPTCHHIAVGAHVVSSMICILQVLQKMHTGQQTLCTTTASWPAWLYYTA